MMIAVRRRDHRLDLSTSLALAALIIAAIGLGIVNELSGVWPRATWTSPIDSIICMSDARAGSADRVIPVASYPLANAPGKNVTVVRVIYGPGGFTRPHYHAGTVTAYVVRGAIKSQLQGGPVETFTVGQTFFEPPGSVHMVSANASTAEEAELLAIFVADQGAQLTTFLPD
jgi:quercetin dioxygenase-like cupin family protein